LFAVQILSQKIPYNNVRQTGENEENLKGYLIKRFIIIC